MKLNKSRAAKAVGITRATLDRHIKENKLSIEKNGRGHVVIDVSELERVYDKVDIDTVSNNVQIKQNNTKDTVSYDAVVKVKDELIEHLTKEIERERKRTESVQERLDDEQKERRRATEQLTALLTDQREKKRGFWSRLLGR
ncbi:MAG: hypothetical protein GY927_21445 [bacterium]|nr:hypothetical protein [bacterium]